MQRMNLLKDECFTMGLKLTDALDDSRKFIIHRLAETEERRGSVMVCYWIIHYEILRYGVRIEARKRDMVEVQKCASGAMKLRGRQETGTKNLIDTEWIKSVRGRRLIDLN